MQAVLKQHRNRHKDWFVMIQRFALAKVHVRYDGVLNVDTNIACVWTVGGCLCMMMLPHFFTSVPLTRSPDRLAVYCNTIVSHPLFPLAALQPVFVFVLNLLQVTTKTT